jgi:hypothetical protein
MFAISAHFDRKKSEGAGAAGTFQVVSLKSDEDNDLTYLVDQGVHFHNLDELREAILRGITDRLTVQED